MTRTTVWILFIIRKGFYISGFETYVAGFATQKK